MELIFSPFFENVKNLLNSFLTTFHFIHPDFSTLSLSSILQMEGKCVYVAKSLENILE